MYSYKDNLMTSEPALRRYLLEQAPALRRYRNGGLTFVLVFKHNSASHIDFKRHPVSEITKEAKISSVANTK